jgi:hypothetical protein
MEKDLMIRGYYRISKIMQNMISCNDKQEIIRLSSSFMDEVQDLISLIYVEENITEEDIEKFKLELTNTEKDIMEETNAEQPNAKENDV